MQSLIEESASGERETPLRVCVTGGAGGLGRAIAERFLRNRAWVHLADVSAEGVARALASSAGLHATVADMTRPEEVGAFVAEACDWMGGIDVLVNCAQFVGERRAVEETPFEEWARIMAVNAGGAFAAIQSVVPVMKRQRSGCLITLLSSAAQTGLPGRAAYVASQSALRGLSETLARELGPYGIRSNAVVPGVIRDEASEEHLRSIRNEQRLSADESEGELLRYVSLRQWTQPEQVAETVSFLASPAASLITGQTLSVSGNVEWES